MSSARAAEGGPVGGGLRAALALCAAALAAAALWPVLAGQLVYDDLWLVARNPALESWSKLGEALTQAHWDFIEPDLALRIGFWRPLAIFALFVGRQLGGGDVASFHAISLALHMAATVVAMLLAERLTRSLWVGFATALIFGLHPVQVESVAWISAVNDPLAGLLVLGALYAFARWRAAGSPGFPILSGVLFAAALLAKESAIAFLLLAPIVDWALPRDERRDARWRAYAPAVAALIAYGIARMVVFGEFSGGFLRVSSYLHLPFWREQTLRLEILGGSLGLLAWPAKLNLFREVRPEIPFDDGPLWTAIAVVVAWLLAALIAWRRRARTLFVGLLFAPAALVPIVVRFESTGRFPVSDRFLYVAVFGVALVVAQLLVRRLPRIPALIAVAALVALAGVKSFARTEFWRDELSVFRGGVAASPRSIYVHWGLGRVLLEEFQREGDLQTLLEARDEFEKAQDLVLETPRDPRVLDTNFDELQSSLGLGWFYLLCALHMPEECVLEEAELVFRALVAKAQTSPEAHCGLGVALRHLGRLDEAEEELQRAVECNPRHHVSWFNLGRLSLERQKWADALEQFQRCVELAPDDVEAWTSLGMAATELGLGERAREALARARRLAPESAEPLIQLGVMAATERRFDVALDFFEQALKLDGGNGPAHLMRAKSLLYLNRPNEALQAFLDASRWLQEPSRDAQRPQQTFEAFYNAGVLSAQLGRMKEALPILEEAARRDPERRWSPGLADEIEKLRERIDSD